MNTVSLVIADDHPLLLKGLGDFLKSKGYKILKQAVDGNDAWKAIVDLSPDIAILDIEMPYLSGINIARLVDQSKINTKVILLSYQIEQSLIELGATLGIRGYLLKEDALVEIEESIKSVLEGEVYKSAKLQKLDAVGQDSTSKSLSLLSPSERKILKKIALDQSSKEIALSFNISERTVEKHRSNIIQKLNIKKKQFSLMTWVYEHKELIKSL